MAKGNHAYFRHSFFARNDPKIIKLITEHGKQAYFHFFALLEMCGEQWLQSENDKLDTFIFHARQVCSELLVTRSKLTHHLLAMQSSLLLQYSVNGTKVEVHVPNFLKFLGKYKKESPQIGPKERKEKERKEKESKEKKSKVKKAKPSPEILFDFLEPEVNDWIKGASDAVRQRWLEKYPKSILQSEITKAYDWDLSKGLKSKSRASTVTNWLGRLNLSGLSQIEQAHKAFFDEHLGDEQ